MSEKHFELNDIHWLMDILQDMDIGLVVLDREYRVHLWNSFMDSHSGISPQKAKGSNLFELFPEVPEDWFRQKSTAVFELKISTFTIWEQRPYLFRFPSARPITGRSSFMYQNTHIIPLESASGKVNHICMLVYDVTDSAILHTDLKATDKLLRDARKRDQLTGLLNFQTFQVVLQTYIQEVQPGSTSHLVIVDIIGFASYNHAHGFPAGDELLKKMAALLQANATPELVARITADRFAILMPDKSTSECLACSERVQEALSEMAGEDISLNCGMALLNPEIATASHWMISAETALLEEQQLRQDGQEE